MAHIHYTEEIKKVFQDTPALKGRVEFIIKSYFPEIRSIKIGRASKSAYYDPNTGTVRLTPLSSFYVIGHEVTHYLQDERHYDGVVTVPAGERSCDLFLFARSPILVADFWNTKDCSYIGGSIKLDLLVKHFTVDEGQLMIHSICKHAVGMKQRGVRDYISWAEKTINKRAIERSKGIVTTNYIHGPAVSPDIFK